MLRGRRLLVLSGAGISTESGIPDYRSPERSQRSRRPMRYQQFVRSPEARRRYWVRSLVGWPRIDQAEPNLGHRALVHMQVKVDLDGIITQNVDGLHQRAGSRNVLELHGTLAVVRCLHCRVPEARSAFQRRLLELNPDFRPGRIELAPDGDADLPRAQEDGFRVPVCLRCRGLLKPDVVFFGENVPKDRLERAWKMLERAEALLVVGSSLTVYSGYRFVARASQQGKPVAIVNRGPTRGDADASVRIDGKLGEVLPALAEQIE
ncbi:MAG: NAD-dependent protein deacetylase [Trueperaceae bacterium]|nr:MAG: NAD-dependent protein deacetylase [Trueperaceae bacterium]